MGVSLLPGQADAEVQDLAHRSQSGDKEAMLRLGIAFEEGRGAPTDLKRARQLYGMAARSSGGTAWIYTPPVTQGGSGHVIPVSTGPERSGLEEARERLKMPPTTVCPDYRLAGKEPPIADEAHPDLLYRTYVDVLEAVLTLTGRGTPPTMERVRALVSNCRHSPFGVMLTRRKYDLQKDRLVIPPRYLYSMKKRALNHGDLYEYIWFNRGIEAQKSLLMEDGVPRNSPDYHDDAYKKIQDISAFQVIEIVKQHNFKSAYSKKERVAYFDKNVYWLDDRLPMSGVYLDIFSNNFDTSLFSIETDNKHNFIYSSALYFE